MDRYDHSATPEAGTAQIRTNEGHWRINTQCAVCSINIELRDTDGPVEWFHLD
jgi:hypothetical protein